MELGKSENKKFHKLIKLTFCTMPFNAWTKFALWLHLAALPKEFKKFNKCLY
jgi:hypothetical protein